MRLPDNPIYIHVNEPETYFSGAWRFEVFGEPEATTEEMIASFSHLPDGWDYGEGGPIPEPVVQRALMWNTLFRLLGFLQTDASPGSDGEISITASYGDHYIEAIIEPDNTISVAYDFQRKQVFYTLRRAPHEAMKIVLALARKILWSASTSSTLGNTMQERVSGFAQHFGTIRGPYPLSVVNASTYPAHLFANTFADTSGTITGSQAYHRFSGDFRPTGFRQGAT
jgi:hypothetical protein